jgi:acyl carrier protein
MDRKDILSQINKIFIDTLDNEEVVIEETTQATDVEEWDSLTHIMLVVTIEKHFKITFDSKEILSWKDVREMMDSIISKVEFNN